MKKIKFWAVLGILSVSIVSGLSYHSVSKADAGLQSKGRIIYNDSTSDDNDIIIDADDHVYLKSNIDANALEIVDLKEYVAQQDSLNAELQNKDVELETKDAQLEESISELNSGLGNINIYVGDDEKLHFVDKDGADSVLPFKSMIEGTSNTTLVVNGEVIVNVDNMPENPIIIAYTSDINGNIVSPCITKIYLGSGIQSHISVNTDNSVGVGKGNYITVGDNYIKFVPAGTWDFGYYVHYIILSI